MADNIGDLAVQLQLDASQFISGLDSSAAKFKAFGADAGKFKVFGSDAGKFEGLGDVAAKFKQMEAQGASVAAATATPTEKYAQKMGELNSLLSGGLISQETFNRAAKQAKGTLDDAAGAAKGFGSALAIAAVAAGSVWAAVKIGEGVFDFFKSGVSEIVHAGAAAYRLGVSLESMGALHLLAGADAEKMDHALMHMSRTLSEATQGSADAKAAFQELHLDASALAKVPLDVSLGKIIDSINGLGTAFDRNNAGMKLFGRVKLMLVSELAPVVKNVADWVADIAGPAGGLRKTFHDAALSLVDGPSSAVEGAENLAIHAHRIEKSFERIGILLNPGYQFDASKAVAKDPFEEEILRQGEKFRDMMKNARASLGDIVTVKGDPTAGGLDIGGGKELDTFAGKIDVLEKKLSAATAAFGLTGEAAERFALSGLGATNAQLAVVDA